MNETEIGFVTHYFGKISVITIKLTAGELSIGDTIRVKGHTSDFTTQIESLQIEKDTIAKASQGQEVGTKVPAHAREHDKVFKVTA